MRLNLFDLIDREGWTLPVTLRIAETPDGPDVIVETCDEEAAS